jgi:glycosyltransferase involved in cell wall biosynthesis
MPEAVTHWHIITGEYPPQIGGVSDYTRLLARGLVAAGDEVEIWAPCSAGETPADPGVAVHRLPGHFGPMALAELDRALRKSGRCGRLLVQYLPHLYGWKAMNVAFCSWLLLRKRLAPWVMFHEIAFPREAGQPWRHQILGHVTQVMAAMMARAAERIFISIPSWEECLTRLVPTRRPVTWLPIPSNMPTNVAAQAVARVRRSLIAAPDGLLVGHFGTYANHITQRLEEMFPALLGRCERRVGLLLGRGSDAFVENLRRRHPQLAGRLHARADLPAEAVSCHLAACDLLLQPYIDGVSSRRTSVMAGLALGRAIVTTPGPATETVWRDQRLVEFAETDAETPIERLLADPQARGALGERARVGYESHFSLRRTIDTLRASA